MESSNNSNTYVKGIIGDLKNCPYIILYRSTNLLNMSITNIDIILENLKKNGNYVKLSKIEGEDYYLFDRLDENNNIRYTGFDTIIYINHLNIPLGFTKFEVVKGLLSEKLKIMIDFNVKINKVENNSNVKIEYALDNITEFISLSKKLLVEKDYGYSTANKINKRIEIEKSFTNYVNNINDIETKPNKFISLNYGLLNSKGLYKLNIITEMTIANGFKNIQLGYYKGEIVIYSWEVENKEIKYTITSLSRKDTFGNPIIYTKRGSYNTINIKTEGTISVNYFSGKFISISVNSNSEVYNIITGERVLLDEENPNHVINIWGNGQIIELPKALSRKSLMEFIPETRNLYIDINNYKQTIHLVKNIGEWYVFRETRYSINKSNPIFKNFLIYTNMTKTITVSEEYDQEPIILNNNILILRTKEQINNTKQDYYSYFVGDGHFLSENAWLAMDIITNDSNINKVYNPEFNCITYGENNQENYRNGSILIDKIDSNILDSYLFSFRRFTCPDNLKVPEIVGTINGLIYYKQGNNIKLL